MTTPIKIDFVSDVSCPWCVIGLLGLEQALDRVGGLVEADIRFQPFELNPDMPFEGQRLVDYAAQRYGSSPEQLLERRAIIRERAAELGFTIALPSEEGRVYNTFDAHRLLHWAGIERRQRELKKALFHSYFTQCLNPGDREVLADAAEAAGLERAAAIEVLESGLYATEVREAEAHWRSMGITGVPAIIINDRYLISGGQPADYFEQALRKIAAEASAPAA
ncbi:DsbA family oxidoreductase [Sphingomonas alba]|uniref:DsbA family oxidoreductase n=1 Tax=Sphingomonas alba TaxID=2908208 RepID=A0ABT0RKH4_9SPHN|nr:DsbA family oxidoreductase [Sphingomonas alba]MCL6683126.1 DsbA family oxidoreductase [Sphingomonas alba]